MNWQDFESTGNACMACQADEGDCVLNACILLGEIWTRNDRFAHDTCEQ